MNWEAITVIAVVGVAALVAAFLLDRASRRRRQRVLESAPDRPIPGLDARAPDPTYVTQAQVDRMPSPPAPGEVPDLSAATVLKAGYASPRFADADGRAVLTDPVVLIAESATAMRELLPAIGAAKGQSAGLVVVAADLDDDLVATLAANRITGTFDAVAVRADPSLLAEVATATGGRILAAADLMSGFLPQGALGACRVWASDAKTSRILV